MNIISSRIAGWREVEALGAALTSGGLFLVWLWLHQVWRGPMEPDKYIIYGIVIGLSSVVYSLVTGRNRQEAMSWAFTDDLLATLGQTLAVSFALFAYLAATHDSSVSRVFLFSYLPTLFVVLVAARKLAAKYLGPVIFDKRHQCGAVLLGSAQSTNKAAAWLSAKSNFGLKAVGWLPEKLNGEEDSVVPKLGTMRQLGDVLEKTGAKVVLVTDFLATKVDVHWLRSVCEMHGARLAFRIDFGEASRSGISCYQDEGISLVTLRDEPLESPLNRMLKRAIDVAIALPVVIVVLPPLAVLVRLVHFFQSPGPLLFNQERVGRYGRNFVIYKFRTMHCSNPDESKQAEAGDVRVFALGRLLRKLSLDEFPQFLNVVQGTMSIVGPRPHMGVHDTSFADVANDYRVRSLIKPGITGLAQVRGFRGPTPTANDIMGRTKSDLYYLENWSLRMDVLIILRTVFQFVRTHKGAV